MTSPLVRIASRGSPLALAQARLARAALAMAHGWDPAGLNALCPIVTFRTTGDRITDRPLAEAGGKGLFVKEIEDALLQGEADIAVHSMKDMPARQPGGLAIAAVLARENPFDVYHGRDGGTFAELKNGARLGTSSVRRAAQALRVRPDLTILPLRGNVETRLAKLARGEADGILLARAGLERLGILPRQTETMDSDLWLPALCQGAIGLEIRENDARAAALAMAVDDPNTHLAIACERGVLAALDGSCRTPVAGLAVIAENSLRVRAEALSLDGTRSWNASREMALRANIDGALRAAARALGEDAGAGIRTAAGPLLPRF